jgi:hypothetical protein
MRIRRDDNGRSIGRAAAKLLLGTVLVLSLGLLSGPATATWTVSQNPMAGDKWVVSDGKQSFTANGKKEAQAQADVLNKFEEKQSKKNDKDKDRNDTKK